MEFTPAQKKAVELDGNSLIVSAAAGSGKTAVLSARVVRLLCDTEKICDADRLLILTFTNAAAAEMRRRISNMLKEKLEKEPENAHIKRQLSLLPAAKICTIHSACFDLIRQNFERLELDPQFTVAEETRLELMRAQLTDDFAEELYERAETENDVRDTISYFTRGRDDSALIRALESGCAFLENEPYPTEFIENACCSRGGGAFDMLPGGFIQGQMTDSLSDIIRGYEQLICSADSCGFLKLCTFYEGEREKTALVLRHVSEGNFDMSFKTARDISFKNHPPRPKDTDPAVWDGFKDGRAELKARFTELRDNFLYAGEETVLSDRKKELAAVRSLLKLCAQLSEVMLKERRRLRLVSFNDAEKYALELLTERDENGNTVKTPLARELSEFYCQIIVDEFQDCSKIQDCIFKALSKDEKNIFAVGDIKQSIYRFRNAYPQIFIDRQSSAQDAEDGTLTAPSRLSLSQNFRSHPKILSFINRVFDTLMTRSRGGIDYAAEHRLEDGGLYADTDCASVTVSLLVGAQDTRQSSLSRLEGEAKFIADKINSIVGRLKIYDASEKKERYVRYADIAVLMRAPATTGAVIEKTLEAAGIGCINNNPSEKYLDTPHVRDVLAYLQTIDNPYNDIPLITLMYSDYFGFTANELGKIRAENKNIPFFDAVKSFAEKDEKTARFVEILEEYREKSAARDVYGIISMIYEQSGILLRVLSEPDGETARANLMLLCDFAAQFESTRYRGLFAFINYIQKLIEKDQTVPAARLRKSDGCVSLLSIHRSKGLEFPVVFLVNAGNDIVTKISGDILLDSALGAGAYVRDGALHRDFSSPCREALKEKIKTDELNEYIRLLYVALTRAESHLFITAAMNAADAEKAIEKAYACGGCPSDFDICSKASFFRWMLYPLINSADAAPFYAFAGKTQIPSGDRGLFKAEVTVLADKTEAEAELAAEKDHTPAFSAEYIKQMTAREYAYSKSTLIPSKLSVSDIKNLKSEKSTKKSVPKPRFLQNGTTGADRGNATHRFLQFCDFSAVRDEASLERELARLLEYEFISKRESELIEKEKILEFLQSDKMRRLNALGTCSKEQRFLFTLPACEIMDTDSTESVIIQGVIDCWYIENGKAVIVDYKTDRVKSAGEFAERYGVQLEMYAAALQKLRGIPTSHKYIYSFALSEFIEV